MPEEMRADSGSVEQGNQDRYTVHFQAQYLQWDVSPVTLVFGGSRLVDECAQPGQRVIKLQPGGTYKLAWPELEGRRYDLVILNKSGWVNHQAPTAAVLVAKARADVRVQVMLNGGKVGSVHPGRHLHLPDAGPEIELLCMEEPCTLLAFAFPL